jgi:uncharacterized protein YaaQ
MKFLIAIVQDYDCDRMLRAVTAQGFRATRIASTGGFLRTGNTTVLMGIADDQVERCVYLIRQSCQSRCEVKLDPGSAEYLEWYPAGVHDVLVGGAVIFILPVARFEQFRHDVAVASAGSLPAGNRDG